MYVRVREREFEGGWGLSCDNECIQCIKSVSSSHSFCFVLFLRRDTADLCRQSEAQHPLQDYPALHHWHSWLCSSWSSREIWTGEGEPQRILHRPGKTPKPPHTPLITQSVPTCSKGFQTLFYFRIILNEIVSEWHIIVTKFSYVVFCRYSVNILFDPLYANWKLPTFVTFCFYLFYKLVFSKIF